MNFNSWFSKNAFRVSIIYLTISLIWIFFSDRFLDSIIQDYIVLTRFQTYKGWFYVIFTSILIYFLVKNTIDKKIFLITALEQTRKELEESEIQARSLIENAPDAFYLSNWNGQIINANQHACDMLGYSKEELLSKTVMELDANCPGLDQVQSLWNALGQNKSIKVEGKHINKKGI